MAVFQVLTASVAFQIRAVIIPFSTGQAPVLGDGFIARLLTKMNQPNAVNSSVLKI